MRRQVVWRVGSFLVGVLVTGLGVWLARQGLDRADKLASVFGLFIGLTGLGVAIYSVLLTKAALASPSMGGTTQDGAPPAPGDPKPAEELRDRAEGARQAGDAHLSVGGAHIHGDVTGGDVSQVGGDQYNLRDRDDRP